MGGFFGAVCKQDAIPDVFFGTDYHSHLGTRRAGMAAYDRETGLQRSIHNIQNSPFRTKFEDVFEEMKGSSAIGVISDHDPQPLLIYSQHGTYAIAIVGVINNADELIDRYLGETGGHFNAQTGGKVNTVELVAALINRKGSLAEGIRAAQQAIDGTASILILRDNGHLIAARDYRGRIPVHIGKNENGTCVSFESFAYQKLGYTDEKELGAGEVVELTADGWTQLLPPQPKKKICSFLWSYYGYSTSHYEGVNVELMRYRNGAIMAEADQAAGRLDGIDSIGGVPDSGTPHAIGYANRCGIPFARPFIKYTPTWPRSFTSAAMQRSRVAKMKQIPVHELIIGKKLLFVDDSIVRGTQLKETVDFLYDNGAGEVHMRSACPPIMYNCKYLNFSRSNDPMELLTRRVIVELEGEEGLQHLEEYGDSATTRGQNLRKAICEKFHFSSLEFQTLEGIVRAIGLPEEVLCTYCWNGKED